MVNDGKLRFKTVILNKKIDNKFTFSKFKTQDILFSKNGYALGSSYIDYSDGKLFLASGNGIFAYTNLDGEIKDLKIIQSNIKDIIKYDKFYETSQYGIKDILIYKNEYICFPHK